MQPEIHPAAAVGFERSADVYERGRPGYPPEALAAVREALGLRRGMTVLELGAGTGRLTGALSQTGARVVAVEPVAAMRRLLRASVPTAEVIAATAEHLPLRAGEADAAVAAQAFHWFDAPRALAELARILPEPAPLALVWNVRDETTPWVRALTDLLEPYRGDAPSHRSMHWLGAFEGATGWTAPACSSFRHLHASTAEGAVDRVLSISFIAALPAAERTLVAERVRDLLPDGERIAFPYRTDVWLTRRRSPGVGDHPGASATIA